MWRRLRSCGSTFVFPVSGKARFGTSATSWRCERELAQPRIPVPQFSPVLSPWRPRGFHRTACLRRGWSNRDLWQVLSEFASCIHSEDVWPLLERAWGPAVVLPDRALCSRRYLPRGLIVFGGEIRFAVASGYGRPPLEVSHEGGIFTTRILNRHSEIARVCWPPMRAYFMSLGYSMVFPIRSSLGPTQEARSSFSRRQPEWVARTSPIWSKPQQV